MTDIDYDSRSQWCKAFAEGQKATGLTDLELAKVFQTSLPTIGRWSRGEAAPHPVGRKPILDWFMKYLLERNPPICSSK